MAALADPPSPPGYEARIEDDGGRARALRDHLITETSLLSWPSDLRVTADSLHKAVQGNHKGLVDEHIRYYHRKHQLDRLNQLDKNGYAPIHYAAKLNHVDIMKKLITAGKSGTDEDHMISVADVTTRENRWTPLHFAVCYRSYYKESSDLDKGAEEQDASMDSSNQSAVMYLIVTCKVNVNAMARDGATPLHLACQHGNENAIDLLLASHAICVNVTDYSGDTPLHKACLSGKTAVVIKYLTMLKTCDKMDLFLPNVAQLTPLHIACREGYVDIVKLLLKEGFHQRKQLVDARDIRFSTPLHLACENRREGSDHTVFTLLLNNADIFAQREGGITAMHIAAKQGLIKIMEMLNSSGNGIFDVVDDNKQTLLHYAAENNQVEMIEYLVTQ